jgi:hypothetical protein
MAMDDDAFEWHERKRGINLEKHGIDFEDALTIWDGPVATGRGTIHLHRRNGRTDHRRRLDSPRVSAPADFSTEGQNP